MKRFTKKQPYHGLLFSLILLLMTTPAELFAIVNGPVEKRDTTRREVRRADAEPLEAGSALPTFQGGGLKKFQKWVNKNITFPKEITNPAISGTVVASFIVGIDGSINKEDIKIESSPNPYFSLEVFNVLSRSPKWEPGIQDGRPRRCKFIIPVVFKNNRTTPGYAPAPRRAPRVDSGNAHYRQQHY